MAQTPSTTGNPPPPMPGSKPGLVYRQSTGELSLDGRPLANGYSGSGPGKNNPDMESSQGRGPIPVGNYTMGRQFHSHVTGPGAIRLTPVGGTQTYGRNDFEIHGDSIRHPGQASEGCIIVPPPVRKQLAMLPGRTLTVTK